MNDPVAVEKEILHAAEVVRKGGVVAFPTETYYGLAVDPFNEKALQKLFRIKGRPELKPVLLLVAGRSQVEEVAGLVPELAEKLMICFWPGPLTLVLPARPGLSSYITGNTGTVGVRMSPHTIAEELLKACGIPLTATSANRTSESPAVTAEEVQSIFGDQIDYVVNGGKTPGKMGSTLIGFAHGGLQCIREGRILFREIVAAVEQMAK